MKQQAEDISLEQIKLLMKALKRLDKDWAVNLAKSISKQDDKNMTATGIYNIVNSRLKHQQYRRLFVLHAQKLLDSLNGQQAKVVAIANEMLSDNTSPENP